MTAHLIGKDNGNYRGGRPRHSTGARYVYARNVEPKYRKMADARGLIPEPRYHAARKLGRPLRKKERVDRRTLKVFASMAAHAKWRQSHAR